MTTPNIRPRDQLDQLPDNTRVTTQEAIDYCGIARTSWVYRAERHGLKPTRRGKGKTSPKLWKLGDVRMIDDIRNNDGMSADVAGLVRMGQVDEHMAAISAAANTRPGDILVFEVEDEGTPNTESVLTLSTDSLGALDVLMDGADSVCLVWNHGHDHQPPLITVAYVNPTTGTVAAQEFVDHDRHGIIRRGPLTTDSPACIASQQAVMNGADQ